MPQNLSVNKGVFDSIGIGSSMPAARLDVVRSSNTDTTARFENGGGSAPAVVHIIEEGLASDHVGLFVGKSDKSYATLITKANQVGIGTVSPTCLFQIAPSNNVDANEDPTNESYFKIFDNATSGTAKGRNGGAAYIDANYYLESSDIFVVKGRGDIKFLIKGSGNVGIGTTNPTRKLQVHTATSASQIIACTSTVSGVDVNHASIGHGASLDGNLQLANSVGNNKVHLSSNGDSYLIGGDVGIGTTNPGAKLDVRGINTTTTIGGIAAFSVGGGDADGEFALQKFTTSAGGSLAFIGAKAKTTGAYPNSVGQLHIGVQDGNNSRSAIIVDSNGNVGIGTTNPSGTLHVHSSQTAQTPTAKFYNGWGSSVATVHIVEEMTSAGHVGLFVGKEDFSSAALITKNKNVGIGTTSPDTSLEIATSSGSANSVNQHIKLSRGGSVGAAISTKRHKDTNDADAIHFNLKNSLTNATSSYDSFRVDYRNVGLYTYSCFGQTKSAEATVIGNNIYVDPWGEVSGQVLTRNNHATYGHAFIEMANGTIKFYNKKQSVTHANVVDKSLSMIIASDNQITDSNGKNPGDAGYINTWSGTGPKVGIGTSVPGRSLDVVGDASGNILRLRPATNLANGKYAEFKSGTTNFIITTGNNSYDALLIRHSNGYVGIGTNNTSSHKLYVNGSIGSTSGWTSSDDRLKHNEQTIIGALDILAKITPKKYIKTTEMYDAGHDFELDDDGNPIDEDGGPVDHSIEAGLIAQELLNVPELKFAVSDETVDDDGNIAGPYGVNYNSLLTYAIAAIKELKQENDDLKSRIENLENN